MDNKPFVSIIIPTFNEEVFVRSCLQSVLNLKYPKDKYEIIVVDNGSKDNTVSICREFTEKVFVCPGVNIASLRNHGAGKAKGEVFAFIDGDCLADPYWLENAVRSLNLEPCVTGAYCEISPDATWVEKTWSLRRPEGRREVQHLGTANFIVPSDIFNKIGGFNEDLKTGEDYEFCVRAKDIAKIILDDRIKVTHLGNPKTVRQFFRRELWHGLGAFGSLNIQKFDKPLIAVICFSVLMIIQITSLVNILFIGNYINIFMLSTAGMIILLLLTVAHQNKRSGNIMSWIRLMILFFLYYFSRSMSLLYLLFGKGIVRQR